MTFLGLAPAVDELAGVRYLFTDVDDTPTTNGRLLPQTCQALWDLHDAGIAIIPVTGGSAGWCEHIVRAWPVARVLRESGAFVAEAQTGRVKFARAPGITAKVNAKTVNALKRSIFASTRRNVSTNVPATDQFLRCCSAHTFERAILRVYDLFTEGQFGRVRETQCPLSAARRWAFTARVGSDADWQLWDGMRTGRFCNERAGLQT